MVLIIGPGNYPLLLTGVQILQGLVAGNAVLVKPAEGCTKALQLLAVWLVEAGLPTGLLTILPESPLAGRLATEAEIDKVVVTGSAAHGSRDSCSTGAAPYPLNNGTVGVRPGFRIGSRKSRSGGQGGRIRLALERERNLHRSAAGFRLARTGQGVGRSPANGSRRKRDPAPFSRCRCSRASGERCARGRRKLLVGGTLPDQSGILPTVLTNVRPDMAIARDESFAPVTSIIPVANSEEAMKAVRRSPYGLGASIFAMRGPKNRRRSACRVSRSQRYSRAHRRSEAALWRSGASGFGVTRGEEGLLDMTTIKVVSTRHVAMYQHLDPLTKPDEELFIAYLHGFHGKSFWERMSGRLGFFRIMIGKGFAGKK